MNSSSSSRFGAGLIASGLCIFTLAMAAYGVFLRDGIDEPPNPAWNGYTVLLVDSAVPEREVESRLVSAGAGKILSRSDVVLSYCEYPGLGEVPLSGLAARFDEADPRYDPYMRSVGNYFSSRDGRYSLYYCADTDLPLEVIVSEAFSGTSFEYRLFGRPEAGTAVVRFPGIVTSAVILFFGAFLGFLTKKYLFVLGLSALVCAGIGFFSGLVILPAALIFQFASAFFCLDFLPRYKRRLNETLSREGKVRTEAETKSGYARNLPEGWFKRALIPLCAFIAGLGVAIAAGKSGNTVGTVLAMAAGVAAVPVIRAGILTIVQARREHRLFFSVPLKRRMGERRNYKTLSAAALTGAVIIAGVRLLAAAETSAFSPGAVRPEIPLPGNPLDTRSITVVPGAPPGNSDLPDLSHYLQHRSYQELYLYGGRDSLSTFSQAEGRIIKTYAKNPVSDEEWIQKRSEEYAASPLGELLMSEEGLLRARYARPSAAEAEEAIPLAAVVIWIGVLLAGWYGVTPLTADSLCGMKSVEPRRRRQAA